MNTYPDTETTAHGSGHFRAIVNERTIHLNHPTPEARHILKAADYVPPDDCILIQGLHHGTHVIALEEKVDLREPGHDVFWAFRSDCTFRFTVGEHSFDWGDATIKEPILRAIAHVKEDDVLVLGHHDHCGKSLGPEDVVNLADPETKHFHVAPRLVKVFFKDDPYDLPRGLYTTEQLMAKFPIQAGYLLNLKTHEGELVTLKPGQETCVKKDMHFYSQVPGGGSS